MKKHGEHQMLGFMDSHLHFLGIGMQADIIPLNHMMSVREMISDLKSHLNGRQMIGRGWNQNRFADRLMPTKNDLDQVSKDIPMVMYRVCGHVAVVNSAMLEGIRVKADTQISGGSIDWERGIVTEAALRLIDDQLQEVGIQDIKRYLIQADQLLLQQGLTDVMSDDFIVTPLPYEMIIQAIRELKAEKKLHVRITEQVHFRGLSDFEDFIRKGYPHRNYGGFRLGPLKLLLDGSLGGRTARLNCDYHDAPGHRGTLVYSDEVVKRYFDLANLSGMDCHIHAIGDGAIDQFLRVMGASLKDTKRSDHRHAIIHAQLATLSQIRQMEALGVHAIVQPIFLESDIAMLDDRLGERRNESYLFRTMAESHIKVGMSTDAPVESFSPFLNLYAAMTRQSVRDYHLGPHLPEEAFTLDEALRCYQEHNRYLFRQEHEAFDSLITLDRPLSDDPEEIRQTQVIEVRIKDEVVYHR